MAARIALAALLVCIGFPLRAQCSNGSPPPCTSRRAVPPSSIRARHFVLLPFRNVTKKPEQDWLVVGAPLMLGQVLGRFRDIDVVSDEALAAARRNIGLGQDRTPDAAQLRKIADETGGWTAVTGNVLVTGQTLRISAQGIDAATSRIIVRAEAEVPLDADVRDAFDRLSVRLLQPTGVPSTAPTLAANTTQSVDAFRAYLRGAELQLSTRYKEAEAEFTKAVRLDSSFALAWAALASTAINTGGIESLLNGRGIAYAAIEHAARLSSRLRPRDAQSIRAMQAIFHGEMRRGRMLLDSLMASDPTDVATAYWLATTQVLAPPVDTAARPPRLLSSPTRAIRLAQMTLDRDPRRRLVYSVPVIVYGLGGGLLWGDIFGNSREFGSFGETMMAAPDHREVPVVSGDTVMLVPRATFDSLPAAERARLRHRSAEVAWEWTRRWLLAAPEEAEPHQFAARVSELRGDYERALSELLIADSLGIQSVVDNIPGWRLSLLVLSGRMDAATNMADSMLAAGTLTNAPSLRTFDRRRAYGAAALVLAKRWDSLARMANSMGPAPGESAVCTSLRREMVGFPDMVLPDQLRRAVMDTVTTHRADIAANPTLSACADVLSRALFPSS